MRKAMLSGHTRGLGAAIAEELLSRNIAMLGVARERNVALEGRFPSLLEQAQLDLGDPAELSGWLADGAVRRFAAGSSSLLLINNAGIVEPVGPLGRQDPAAVARAVGLNVAAPMMLSSAIAAQDADDIRILHISSGAGRNAYPGWSVYCATKAALDHHARAVALDASRHVRICSLAPGVIDTDMQALIRAVPKEDFPMRERFEELKHSGQLVKPQDCARQIVDYLLDARFGDAPVADLRS